MAFEQQKATLCWPNLIDKCTLVSSSSNHTRPIDRLQKRVLKDRAITTDTTFSITATLDKSRPLGVVALFSHNISVDGLWRVRVYDDVDALLEDSGWMDAWPAVFQSTELAWEDDNFWSGQASDEDRVRFTTQMIWFADRSWYAKKVVIDIADDTNSDSYISIGRAFIADVFQPDYNISYGIRWAMVDSSSIETALDGTEYFDKIPQVRECTMAFDWLSETEAFSRLFRMRRDVGITEEVLFAQRLILDTYWLQRTMLCRASQADPVTHPDVARHTHGLSLKEIL